MYTRYISFFLGAIDKLAIYQVMLKAHLEPN
jgi:hypothetical protein